MQLVAGATVMALPVSLTEEVWDLREYPGHLLKRCLSAFLVTFRVAFLLLFMFDRAPLDDLELTLTRTILVAFPASFAATAVDFMK